MIYLHAEPVFLLDAIKRINEDIERIVQWAVDNKLTINPGKTKAMILGTLRFVRNVDLDSVPQVRVGESAIPFSDSVEYLGVTINSTLSWEKQATKTISKVNSALYQLKLCRQLLPVPLRVKLVSALMLPHFDYCCTVLTNITGQHNLRLQRALNRCVRFIFNLKRDEHITPYLVRLGWLKIDLRRSYLVGSLTFSVLRKEKPQVIFSNFTFRHENMQRNTRSPTDILNLPLCRTEFFKRSFCFSAAELWNSLPSDIRNTTCIGSFKAKLYKFLFSSLSA
ncbi:uncharacterized protein LOC143893340 [Temnothorax americanus]|uniref:uncharacterized protein LOC143893340 n=1 Tax=Temnothorax americanus TaxID=1964332 RepID=UPI004068B49E